MKTITIEKTEIYKKIINFETKTGKTVTYNDKKATVYDVIHRQSGKSGGWYSSSNIVIGTFDHEPTETEFKNFVGRLRAVWTEERVIDVIEITEKQFIEIEKLKKEQASNNVRKYRREERKGTRKQREQNVAIFQNPENIDEKGTCIDVKLINAGDKYPKNISEFDEMFGTDYESQGFEFSFVGKATGAKLHDELNK